MGLTKVVEQGAVRGSGGAVPVVKQCKWWDMESTRSASGGSRSSTSGGAVGSSANGGAAHGGEHTVQLRTQTQNLRSTHDFRAEFGKVHGIFLHRWIALDLSF
jgi:hypothetical protein